MVKNIITKNKKGWMRLVEAFVAIVLLTSVLLVITSANSSPRLNFQEEIYQMQGAVLRDIQLNESLRAEILNVQIDAMPLEWEDFESEAPKVRERIIFLSPKDLECSAQICIINEPCVLSDADDKEVYAKSVVISANATRYSPRQLKMFCIRE